MNILPIISQAVYCFYRRLHEQKYFRAAVCGFVVTVYGVFPPTADATIVRMVTHFGAFNIELHDTQAPNTVANFLDKYITTGRYNNSMIHRHATVVTSGVSVLQGGGIGCCDNFGKIFHIPTAQDLTVQNEFNSARPNIRGTIAMYKTAGPDSAVSEWIINLDNNSVVLDDVNNRGGFTVFGRVLDRDLHVIDKIAALDVIDLSSDPIFQGWPFAELPVVNYEPMNGLQLSNFVFVTRACLNNDADGACSGTEDQAPDGDGNSDGTPDREQANVTTIVKGTGGTATFSAPNGLIFEIVSLIDKNTVLAWLTTFTSPPGQSAHFNNSMFTFTLTGVTGTNGIMITMHDNASARPTHYYAYGPTPDNTAPHWYDFTFDGETGAKIEAGRITLHFVDGKRGDEDLEDNNITHTGAQAVLTPIPSTDGQSGGCSITAKSSQSWRGGDWALVSMFLVALAIVRKRARQDKIN